MCFKKLVKLAEKAIKKYEWYHFSLLKMGMIFFTLFMLTIVPLFAEVALSVQWYWYFVAMVVCFLPLLKRMYS